VLRPDRSIGIDGRYHRALKAPLKVNHDASARKLNLHETG
jgi:hypothetical protein